MVAGIILTSGCERRLDDQTSNPPCTSSYAGGDSVEVSLSFGLLPNANEGTQREGGCAWAGVAGRQRSLAFAEIRPLDCPWNGCGLCSWSRARLRKWKKREAMTSSAATPPSTPPTTLAVIGGRDEGERLVDVPDWVAVNA